MDFQNQYQQICFLITKKLYDDRLSSTPLHTLIEKQAVHFYVFKKWRFNFIRATQQRNYVLLWIPWHLSSASLSQKMAAWLVCGVQSSSKRQSVVGHPFPHRQCVSSCILKKQHFSIVCDIFYCKLFLLNGSQR